ncbi:ROK family protein [Moorella stamsii]|nr:MULTISPECIES: ROK family protein [Moorella]
MKGKDSMLAENNARFTIGIDMGGTKILTALVNSHGNIVRTTRYSTAVTEGKDRIIEQITQSVHEVSAGLDLGRDIIGIGVSCAGPVDPENGVLVQGTNLGWDNAPLKSIVEDRFKLPVYVENDANAAAIAEYRLGAGAGSKDMVYVTVSTGIGGGLILGGQIYRGANFAAGEIGHIIVEADGPECNCGSRGCVEAVASGPATARRAVERIRRGETSAIIQMVEGELDKVTGEIVYRAAANGDPLAGEVVYQSGRYIGIALASLVNILNPEIIVIGGGVAKAGELLFKPLRENFTIRVMRSQREKVKVVPSKFGSYSSVMGAAFLPYLTG